MSILASLVRAYERLSEQVEMPQFGFATQNIHFCIVLNAAGQIVGTPTGWETDSKGRPLARAMNVPYFGGRSGSSAPPYFLWDNSAYVLGASGKEGYDAEKRFEDFKSFHLDVLSDTKDEGLLAVVRFLTSWKPQDFGAANLIEQIKDRNIVFRLASEKSFVHERDAAVSAWRRVYKPDTIGEGICLISGEKADIARLHPPIVSFDNPARIVSFDKDNDAFSSYGHVQAENAPTGIAAAFAYTAVLNRFLTRNSGHRVQIGDASTVFWADSSNIKGAEIADAWGGWMLDSATEDKTASKKIEIKLKRIIRGEQLSKVEPDLADGVRFCVLGLAPNAARLSIRFYFEDDFGVLIRNYLSYMQDIEFRPWPTDRPLPSISNCVLRTAPARLQRGNKVSFDRDQISPLLAGELLRSILTGSRFPGALLSLLVMRIRSDHLLDSIRIALIKAVIVRAMRLEKRLPQRPDGTPMEDYLVRSDPDDPNPARRLGRLFAVIERAQLAALGDGINATVKDKFLGAAAATPQQVFVNILTNSFHHTKRLRNGHSDASWIKDAQHARRVGAGLERDIGLLWASFKEGFPAQHSSEEQGLFFVGYYQERFGGKPDPDTDVPEFDHGSISDGEE